MDIPRAVRVLTHLLIRAVLQNQEVQDDQGRPAKVRVLPRKMLTAAGWIPANTLMREIPAAPTGATITVHHWTPFVEGDYSPASTTVVLTPLKGIPAHGASPPTNQLLSGKR